MQSQDLFGSQKNKRQEGEAEIFFNENFHVSGAEETNREDRRLILQSCTASHLCRLQTANNRCHSLFPRRGPHLIPNKVTQSCRPSISVYFIAQIYHIKILLLLHVVSFLLCHTGWLAGDLVWFVPSYSLLQLQPTHSRSSSP